MLPGMLKVRLTRTAAKASAVAIPVKYGSLPPPELRTAADAAGFDGASSTACVAFADGGRRLLVGVGDQILSSARLAGAVVAARLEDCERIAIDARGLAPARAAAMAEGACLRAWRCDAYRTRTDPNAPVLQALDLIVDDPDSVGPILETVEAGVRGACFARELVMEPANVLTPAVFAGRLEALRAHGIEVDTLKPAALRQEGMGGLLAAGAGSVHKPRLVVLRWPGTLAVEPVVFVGKGITFDTGGICIKPADGLMEMKADMAGAAACAGAILALALRRSPAPAAAVLPLAENAIGGSAYRPGDVLKMSSGHTVEVVDTDAEGRLVLADALTYASRRLRPRAMIDVATLTGSIVTALGQEAAGVFGSHPAMVAHLAAAGAAVDEPVWPMPIGRRHRADLDSDIADLRHCLPGRMQPDACHAAAFLREFAGDVPWAHLDIAGVDMRAKESDRHAAGPTGFGARLLDHLVRIRFEDEEPR